MARTTETTVPKQLTPFKPGQSGNPAGRPKGSRHKLGEDFIQALYADFQENGKGAIERVRTEKPDAYLKVIASTLPKEVNLNANVLSDLSDDEIVSFLDALRSSEETGPGKASRPRTEAKTRH